MKALTPTERAALIAAENFLHARRGEPATVGTYKNTQPPVQQALITLKATEKMERQSQKSIIRLALETYGADTLRLEAMRACSELLLTLARDHAGQRGAKPVDALAEMYVYWRLMRALYGVKDVNEAASARLLKLERRVDRANSPRGKKEATADA